MKSNIISVIIGCLLGAVIGITSIHQQQIQRQKEMALIREYATQYEKEWIAAHTEEETINATEYWKAEEMRQKYEAQRFIQMRDATLELEEQGIEIPPPGYAVLQ